MSAISSYKPKFKMIAPVGTSGQMGEIFCLHGYFSFFVTKFLLIARAKNTPPIFTLFDSSLVAVG